MSNSLTAAILNLSQPYLPPNTGKTKEERERIAISQRTSDTVWVPHRYHPHGVKGQGVTVGVMEERADEVRQLPLDDHARNMAALINDPANGIAPEAKVH